MTNQQLREIAEKKAPSTRYQAVDFFILLKGLCYDCHNHHDSFEPDIELAEIVMELANQIGSRCHVGFEATSDAVRAALRSPEINFFKGKKC